MFDPLKSPEEIQKEIDDYNNEIRKEREFEEALEYFIKEPLNIDPNNEKDTPE